MNESNQIHVHLISSSHDHLASHRIALSDGKRRVVSLPTDSISYHSIVMINLSAIFPCKPVFSTFCAAKERKPFSSEAFSRRRDSETAHALYGMAIAGLLVDTLNKLSLCASNRSFTKFLVTMEWTIRTISFLFVAWVAYCIRRNDQRVHGYESMELLS